MISLHQLTVLSLVNCRSIFYKCPSFHPHIPRPPEGVVLPRKVCIHLLLSYLPPNSTGHCGLFGKVFDNSTAFKLLRTVFKYFAKQKFV